jgi:phenylalanyl-tRNA synthetase beta chain
VEFPQKVFELGKVTAIDSTRQTRTIDENWLAAATSHINASFTEIKSILDTFMSNMGLKWEITETFHSTFIKGRAGIVTVNDSKIGIVGEIDPIVLEAWKLENPVATFEVNFQAIIDAKRNS